MRSMDFGPEDPLTTPLTTPCPVDALDCDVEGASAYRMSLTTTDTTTMGTVQPMQKACWMEHEHLSFVGH